MKLHAKVVRNANGAPQFEIKYKEAPYRVKLFKFQENYPDDSVIDCIMTSQANGDLYFRQDLQALVNEFYTVGETYEFFVKHDFSHNGYYELNDERGIPFRLPVPKGMRLLTGSSVKCRLFAVEPSGGQLKLIDTSALFESGDSTPFSNSASTHTTRIELDAKGIADRVFADLYPDEDPAWDPDKIFELLFKNDDYYEQAVNRGILEYILNWRQEEGIDWGTVQQRLHEIRHAIMYVLEGSTILLEVEPLRRKSLQHRLTVLANNVSGYYRAAKQLFEDTHKDKISRVLGCLRTSGYIYEAELQLDMMMRIFSLSGEVMVENMSQIFDIIHARTEDFWHDEPFRKAFIRLLQMYVEQVRRGIENGTADHDSTIRSLIEAISIQLLLADREGDAEVFDYNLNLASLYRYASMLRTSVPENALRNAFLALMDVTRRPSGLYRWGDSGSHDLISSKLTASPVGLEEAFEKTYESRPVMLRATSDSITISRTDVKTDSLKVLDLNGVGVWPRLQILTTQKIATVTNTSDLKRARDMWNAIEKALFSEEEDVRRPLQRRLAKPVKDDVCTIRVLRQIDDVTFAVEITDDYYEGRGQITVEDMVNYKVPNLKYEHFCGEGGFPLKFQAKVKRVDDKTIHFTILDALLNYSHEHIQNDNPMRCVIKSSNQYGKVGVSELGDAVKFKPNGAFANIKVGDVVIGNFWTRPSNAKEKNYIEGVVVEVLENPEPFVTADAFSDLLFDYADGEVFEDPDAPMETSENTNGSDMLSDQRLTELMALVERKAAGESDYMKAFNNIGFARLLAKMARNDRRRDFYEAWMRLISILHHFAINGTIDNTSLADFEQNDKSRFDTYSELYRRYLQLKVVSYKGQPQMRDEIWGYMSHEDEEIRNLASNVMAFNLIAENSSASVLGEIEDRINNILHVNARKSTLHSFGSENKTTEFKSSLLFPPNNHMRANPELQTIEIMKELCALLNADGGTLYLGVNDFGMGVGIENDLAYRDKVLDGTEDKYDLYFRRSVCRILGKDADAYVESSFQEFGGKKIYVIKVKPYYTAPLKVDGVIYERHGSSKLPFYDPEDIRRFTERRAEERARQRLSPNPKTLAEEIEPEKEKATVEPDKPKQKVKTEATTQPEAIVQVNPERIHTRAGRPVCPASYDPNHNPATTRYLEIRKQEFQMVPDFYGYSEDDDDLLLVLPLKDEDVRNWIVLGYEDGTVCRVPMRLFFDKQDYTPGKRYTDSPLVFADILDDDDALITLSRNVNGNWNARADRTENIPEVNSMRSAGERVFNTVKEEYIYNVITGATILNYQDLFNRTNKDAGKNFTTHRQDRLYQQLHKDHFMD